ncbi:MAG: LysR family transcriptional regulator [Cellvibrionaceae bacterium]|nr:LysR family transcriptional regulator [Cellvibrionaceae bacterium]
MRFTLRQLEVFTAIAKTGSVAGAAEMLSMSQSATSAALQELENRYNTKLYERKGKRLILNNHGAQMRSEAEKLLAQAHGFEGKLAQSRQSQQLKIGASHAIANYLVFDYLAQFEKQYPEINVDICVGSTPEITLKVLNYEVDFGLVEGESNHESLHIEKWRADSMIAFCANTHPLAKKKQLSDNDILACQWIIREPRSGHRQTFDRGMQGLLSKLKIRVELSQNEAIKNAVKSGLGVGCLSGIAIKEEIEAKVFSPLGLNNRKMDRHFYIVQRKDNREHRASERWIDFIK